MDSGGRLAPVDDDKNAEKLFWPFGIWRIIPISIVAKMVTSFATVTRGT